MPDGNVKSFEKEAFRKRLTTLAAAASISDADFADVIYVSVTHYGVAEDDFRDTFGMTRGAIERWMTMRNLPQPMVRAKIIRWVEEHIH